MNVVPAASSPALLRLQTRVDTPVQRRALTRATTLPAPPQPKIPDLKPAAVAHLFASLVENEVVAPEQAKAVHAWLLAHADGWRGGPPREHSVPIEECPSGLLAQGLAEALNLDSENVLRALSDEVGGGVCLAETEAVAREALAARHAHPQTWVRAVDAAQVTDAQVQAILRSVLSAALAGDGGADSELDVALAAAAQDPESRALLQQAHHYVYGLGSDALAAITVAPAVSGRSVSESSQDLAAALQAHGPGLFEVIVQMTEDGAVKRHAVLLCTAPSVNGPWFYDPNHVGFFCAPGGVPRSFVHDFADYVNAMYGKNTTWHWIAAFC